MSRLVGDMVKLPRSVGMVYQVYQVCMVCMKTPARI